MKLKFYGEEFPFELIEYTDSSITCLLVLRSKNKEKFEQLCEAEEACEEEVGPWYLDMNGERLEPEALFAASPWSLENAGREIKLLSRFYRGNGQIKFDTPDGYDGESFKWLRG